MTEREYAKSIGVPRTTLEHRKKLVLQKLKNFFEKFDFFFVQIEKKSAIKDERTKQLLS